MITATAECARMPGGAFVNIPRAEAGNQVLDATQVPSDSRTCCVICLSHLTAGGPFMRRAVMAMLALWALAGMPAVGASDDPNKVQAQSQKTPKEQFQAVLDAYQEAQRDFSQAYSKAKTDEERSKNVSEKYP